LELDFLEEPEALLAAPSSSASASARRGTVSSGSASGSSSRGGGAAPPAKVAKSRSSSASSSDKQRDRRSTGSAAGTQTPSRSPKAPSAQGTAQKKAPAPRKSTAEAEPAAINHKLAKAPTTPSSGSKAAASRTGTGKTPSKTPSSARGAESGAEDGSRQRTKAEASRKAWDVGDTIFAKVATWYQPDECPFPNPNSWYCKGSIVSKTARTVVVKFPCFDAEYNRPLSYVDVSGLMKIYHAVHCLTSKLLVIHIPFTPANSLFYEQNFTIPDLPKNGKIVTKADINKYDPNS
jgi:hypothetical protein